MKYGKLIKVMLITMLTFSAMYGADDNTTKANENTTTKIEAKDKKEWYQKIPTAGWVIIGILVAANSGIIL